MAAIWSLPSTRASRLHTIAYMAGRRPIPQHFPIIFGWRRPCAAKRHAVRCYRSEEHTSELQSLMRISYAVFCLKKKKKTQTKTKKTLEYILTIVIRTRNHTQLVI